MKLRIGWIGRTKESSIEALTNEYVRRLRGYIVAETSEFASEEALLKTLGKSSRVPPVLVLLDRQGKQLRSGQIAELIGDYQDGGTQELVFAIGPADGWSHTALTAADFKLSFGPITLPHELARLVLAEQLYRAFTILNRHPYHSGH
ncbi:MAG: 23S rRNA (pseudouridine(1915)-N(3))-methyltransferase RlmH [Candidatus Korobacteraceae bacterium]